MRSLVPKLLVIPLALLSCLALAAGASAAPTFSGAFKVPGNEALNSNDKIIAGPDGNVWFTVATVGKEVAKITPSGTVTEYALPEASNATGLAAGPEGKIWLTGVEKAISFSPADPEGTEKTFKVESIGAGGQIVLGPGGEMWVASNNEISHFSPAEPEAKNEGVPSEGTLTPLDIDRAGSGLVISSANSGRLVSIGADGKQGKDIPLGGETMTSQGVAGSTGGQIAFSKSDQSEGLGLVTPPAPPTADLMPDDPFGVATGADGNYWFAMSAAHGLERLTPTGQASALAFPGFEKWFPRQITAGPGGTLWVTMEVPGANEYAIAKVTGVEAPPTSTATPPTTPSVPAPLPLAPTPDTMLGKTPKKLIKIAGGKATVKFTFSSTVAGASFQCGLVKVPTGRAKNGKKKAAPQPSFAACGSPKTLKVGVGKYRFAVRSVARGLTDASPAVYGFKVVRAAPRRR